MSPLEQGLHAAVSAATGVTAPVRLAGSLQGGTLNRTGVITQGTQPFFIKVNKAVRLPMFEAEAEGLRELNDTDSLRVPNALCAGTAGDHAFLVMEFLDLVVHGDERALGEGLAALHTCTSKRYGWHRDNTIGLTPQRNTPEKDWAEFWREHRLGYQLQLAVGHGHGRELAAPGGRLLEAVPQLLAGHRPPAAVLHGDLWGGNKAFLRDGTPVLFDPAVYHGDPETDLAMCELFGGFGAGFFAAYQASRPRQPGHAVRRDLYQLYHVLNHLNLFGAGYLDQAKTLVRRLLAELG